jgi:acid phosphatase
MHRHGSRGPAALEEEDLLNSLVQTLREGHSAIQHAHLPENLHFLKNGYDLHLQPENLTIIGRQQLFNHGVEYALSCSSPPSNDTDVDSRFGLKYPNFTTDTLLSSYSQRVIDSMYFFAQGRFGREVEGKKLLTVSDLHDPVSWIIPEASCPDFDWHYPWKASSYGFSLAFNNNIIVTGDGEVERHIPTSYHRSLK